MSSLALLSAFMNASRRETLYDQRLEMGFDTHVQAHFMRS